MKNINEKKQTQMSDEDALKLLEDVSKQFRIYHELTDLARLANPPVFPKTLPPSPDNPQTTTLPVRKLTPYHFGR